MNASHETDDVCASGVGPAGSTEYAYQEERIKFDEILLETRAAASTFGSGSEPRVQWSTMAASPARRSPGANGEHTGCVAARWSMPPAMKRAWRGERI